MNRINFIDIYLGQSNLIEASAGTGKTNIISLLYIRFLFGINLDKCFLNIFMDNILVVTFTESAILEIKNRIINNIRKLRISCILKYCIDNNLKDIYFFIKDKFNIINLLIEYENYIDTSSIFTIHSFCKKILFDYFLLSKIDSRSSIIDNEDNLIKNFVILFWRKYFYLLPINIGKIIFFYWPNPDSLFKFIKSMFNIINIKFNYFYKYNSILNCYNSIINIINLFKKYWLFNYNYIYNFFFLKKKKIKNIVFLKKSFKIICLWSESKTIDFYIPDCLFKFYNLILEFKYLNYNKIISILYFKINSIFLIKNDLYYFIIFSCFNYVKKKICEYKNINSILGFNDLIVKLNDIIVYDKNCLLSKIIRKKYPIVLIDEFQDTDFLQYNIFYNIYIKKKNQKIKIIFMGDPKQSIYSFRGANILNYIKFKNNIDFLYNLNVNWRSSSNFIKSLNYLFTNINNPFFLNKVKYELVLSSFKNKSLNIFNNNNLYFPFNFFLLKNIVSKSEISDCCAFKICEILESKKKFLYFKGKKRNLLPSDISILVYKNSEIKLIFNSLKKFNLPINCTLYKSSIFDTIESKEIMFILKTILFPESKNNMSISLSSKIFNYNFSTINQCINNDLLNLNLIDKFNNYFDIWDKFGIYSLINYILDEFKKNSSFDFDKDNEYCINILHIAEILQEKSYEINDKKFLINWFSEKILNKDLNIKSKYYLRTFIYDKNGIKISTIHKSKGLEFNIVWIPFLINLKKNKFLFFLNNIKNFNLTFIDFKKYDCFFDKELFSEEMRLLYVAITRAIYQCNIFLYKLNFNDFFNTSIAKLLNFDNNISFSKILNNKKFFLKKKINFSFIDFNILKKKKFIFNYKNIFYKKKNFKKKISFLNIYKIINYSKLCIKFLYINDINIENFYEKKKYYSFYIPKGPNIGNFFHKILENINFSYFLDNNYILNYMYKFDINKKWFFFIKKIIRNVFSVNLPIINTNLLNLNKKKIFKEFSFFLPVVNNFDFILYKKIIIKYDFISSLYKNFNFIDTFKGFLNGIIDLVFIYKNKYYIIDYKSNWFGDDLLFYNKNNLYKMMSYHRYDIQYQFYVVALHKYLKLNIINYNYKLNFGGVYYIFLRGLLLDIYNNSYYGIFYTKPKWKLIKKLSNFFKI